MKRLLLAITVMWLCMPPMAYAHESTDSLRTRPKIGLVLSGGGARGAAHIGVIRLIEEMKIPIDYVVGTSMGAIVGGLYAIGYTADEMDSLMMVQDWKTLLSNDVPRQQQPYALRMATVSNKPPLREKCVQRKLGALPGCGNQGEAQ